MPQFLNVSIFAGQGTAAVNAPQTREQALLNASFPSGTVLLSSCWEAFHTELKTLTRSEHLEVAIDPNDFKAPSTLLTIPSPQYTVNPILSGINLLLIQTLSYQVACTDTSTSLSLQNGAQENVGVFGLSSGTLSACVVATSSTTLEYITNAVAALRLAFWIGVRTQQYRRTSLQATGGPADDARPWSLVLSGLGRSEMSDVLAAFSALHRDLPPLYLTAVMGELSVTISGRPDVLATFAEEAPASLVMHKTSLNTLYHSQVHAGGAREAVLKDVARRDIHFPTFADIKIPIWSTYTGQPIDQLTSGSLVTAVVDMILTQPIHWDQVMQSLVTASGQEVVRLINVGPGAGLAKTVKRAFPDGNVLMLDLTAPQKPPAVCDVSSPTQVSVAIVGMAVNMPGAPDVAKLWEVLEKGINTIAEIPERRFKVSDYMDAGTPSAGRSMKAHTGNFIDDADAFDHKFFKVSPREARSMDPQARVLLHTAYEALEDSGYVPGATPSFQPETFGCYVGVATGDYVQNLRNDVDVYYSTGTLRAFLSGRISYAMKFGGPSVVVDTACSSSLVAIYQACRALTNGDCNAALAGGVNVITSPDMFLGLDRGHFLSPTGQCKAFDASADGYSRGEGCGLFVLKRLTDAVAEHDSILGVIRGVEVNQSGLSHSITHPHAPTQMALFKQVLERAGIDAHRVSVVEAHGTGTQAGDPSELEGIRGVFAVRRTKENPLHVTSVKANIGHLEAASGGAGLAKLLLMLKHQTIPRQISLKKLNPRIADLASDNTVIDTEHAPWLASAREPRVALLNNFGAAGSNGALLLEEHISTPCQTLQTPIASFVVGLSAKTGEALSDLKTRYVDWLGSSEAATVSLSDIAYTSTARRILYDRRLAVTASSKDELAQKISIASGKVVGTSGRKVAFVFSGQGSQYRGMGASFYKTIPLFKGIVDECHSFLTASGFPGVLQAIVPEEMPGEMSQEEEFEVYQPAIFTLEYALARLWMSWGLTPVVVVGHSLGEYVAHVVAGVLSLKGALTLIADRVRFMVSQCAVNSTGMIAINRGSEVVQPILSSLPALSGTSIACYNSHNDCVVAGPLEQLHILKAHLDAEVGCKNVLLSVPFGYHSSAMDPFLSDLVDVGKRITISSPTIPVVSNVFGEVINTGVRGVFSAEYYARHCSEPVQFEKGMTALFQSPGLGDVDVWIEIGPHSSTLPMLKVHPLLPKDAMLLASTKKHQDGWTTMASTLAQLYTTRVDVQWREVFSHLPSVTCTPLPAYPWSKSKFWVSFKEEARGSPLSSNIANPSQSHLVSEYSMLHIWVQYPSEANGQTAVFETPIADLAKSILGHRVGDHPLCPASVYHELALSGVELTAKYLELKFKDAFVVLGDIDYAKPLVYSEAVSRVVRTSTTLRPDGFGSWKVSSQMNSVAEDHCTGSFKFQASAKTSRKFSRVQPVVLRQITAVTAHKDAEIFSTRTAYEVIFPRVVDYAKEYHTMKNLTVSPDGMEGYAIVQLPPKQDRDRFVVHPVFMDTLLHVAGFVANMQGGVNDAFICSKVDSVKVLPELVDEKARYGIYISNAWLADGRLVLAEAYAVDLGASRKIIAHLKGMHFRKVQLSSLKRSLAIAAGKSQSQTQQLQPSLRRTITRYSTAPSTIPTSQSLFKEVTSEVVRIIAETCGVSPVAFDVNIDLEAHGVDSLLSIEISHKLAEAFPNADLHIMACQTVADIVQDVAGNISTPSAPRDAPYPDSCPSETSTAAMDEIMDVKSVLASALGIDVDEITDDADFEALGLDSLTAIEAHAELQKVFEMLLPPDIFVSHKNTRDVQAYITSQSLAQVLPEIAAGSLRTLQPSGPQQLSQSSLDRMVTTLQLDNILVSVQRSSDKTRTPLFLIHDGGGLINYLTRISPIGRDLWGFNNPNFLSGHPWDSLPAMAKEYGEYITKTASGPVMLGGWSFGGVVAFEAARQLMERGVDVTGVLLIDSPSPVDHVPLSDDLLGTVVQFEGWLSSSDLGLLVQKQFQMNARILGKYNGGNIGCPYPSIVLLRSSDGYNPVDIPGIPPWLADRRDQKQATLGWESFIGTPVKVIDIPGHHFSPFQASNIGAVSKAIMDGCTYLESGTLRTA